MLLIKCIYCVIRIRINIIYLVIQMDINGKLLIGGLSTTVVGGLVAEDWLRLFFFVFAAIHVIIAIVKLVYYVKEKRAALKTKNAEEKAIIERHRIEMAEKRRRRG